MKPSILTQFLRISSPSLESSSRPKTASDSYLVRNLDIPSSSACWFFSSFLQSLPQISSNVLLITSQMQMTGDGKRRQNAIQVSHPRTSPRQGEWTGDAPVRRHVHVAAGMQGVAKLDVQVHRRLICVTPDGTSNLSSRLSVVSGLESQRLWYGVAVAWCLSSSHANSNVIGPSRLGIGRRLHLRKLL
jgi:hypothetical protein